MKQKNHILRIYFYWKKFYTVGENNGNEGIPLKKKQIILSIVLGILVVSGVIGLFVVNADKGIAKDEVTKEDIVAAKNESQKNDKDWRDVSNISEDSKVEVRNANDLISSSHYWFKEENVSQKTLDAGLDNMYHYYLETMALQSGLGIIKVEGIAIEKDFKNMENLAGIIVKDRKSNSAKEAVVLLRELLHDLDVAVNGYNDGNNYGVAYMVDGKNINKIEGFIKSHQ